MFRVEPASLRLCLCPSVCFSVSVFVWLSLYLLLPLSFYSTHRNTHSHKKEKCTFSQIQGLHLTTLYQHCTITIPTLCQHHTVLPLRCCATLKVPASCISRHPPANCILFLILNCPISLHIVRGQIFFAVFRKGSNVHEF